jgi:hypothetical protein
VQSTGRPRFTFPRHRPDLQHPPLRVPSCLKSSNGGPPDLPGFYEGTRHRCRQQSGPLPLDASDR